MESIKIENLKSLKDTGTIPLKSVNLLLGANSSGKSTFLRTFPLLKQSIEVKTRGPILWYGDYVDFGDFNAAVKKDASDISFHFDIKLDGASGRSLYPYRRDPNFLYETLIHLQISIKSYNESARIDKLIIQFEDQFINIGLSPKGRIEYFKVNESDYTDLCENIRHDNGYGLLPHIREISKQNMAITVNTYHNRGLLFYNQLFEFVKKRNRKTTSYNKLNHLLTRFHIGSKKTILESVNKNTLGLKHWKSKIENWQIENNDFNRFNDLLIATRIPSILEYIEEYLIESILNFYYIAPLRATAQRYYRRQDLAVAEVDFQGQNLAMFIDNMTEKTLASFQEWVSKHFDFYPYTQSSEGHISLRIIDAKTKEDYNIADRGFGYSQLLPVITLLWSVVTRSSSTYRRRRNKTNTIILAIEQPELHLHPSLQAQLTDAIIASINLARENDIQLKLIIETHSQTIVNALGHHIADNGFSANNASIVLFEKNTNSTSSKTSLAYYNSDGYLENWPIGFFETQE